MAFYSHDNNTVGMSNAGSTSKQVMPTVRPCREFAENIHCSLPQAVPYGAGSGNEGQENQTFYFPIS